MNRVENYVLQFPEDIQILLNQVRATIKEAAPGAIEFVFCQMPAYKLNNTLLVYFAGFKNHIGFYASPSGHAKFAGELSEYKQGKGSAIFPYDKPLPLDLIKRIALFRWKTISAAQSPTS